MNNEIEHYCIWGEIKYECVMCALLFTASISPLFWGCMRICIEIFDIQKYPVSAKKNSQIMNCK